MQITNGSFETPVVQNRFAMFPQAQVPGWSTTGADGKIETWNGARMGVPSAAGAQHIEVNSDSISTIYQDVPTTPGTQLVWRIAHRGRNGSETMRVQAGPPGGTLTSLAQVTDGTSTWGRHGGQYLVPAAQTVTRLAFTSVKPAGDVKAEGDLLDDVSFGTAPCPSITKTVTDLDGGTVEVGDILEYRSTVRNDGGTPALAPSVTDPIPAGLTYVPNSLSVIDGSTTITRTDAPDGDGAKAVAGTVRFDVGDPVQIAGQPRQLVPGDTDTVVFRAQVTSAAASQVVQNIATFATVMPDTATTGSASVTVDPLADLAATKAMSPVSQVAGGQVTVSVGATNSGPSTATGVVATDILPAELTFVSSADGCTNTSGTVSCPLGSIASGTSVTTTFLATVDGGAAAGSAIANSTGVTGDQTDPVLADNTTTAIVVVSPTPVSDLAVALAGPLPELRAGQHVSGGVSVVNTGPDPALGVVLTLTVPAEVTSADPSTEHGACSRAAQVVTCPIGDLAAGETVTLDGIGVIASSAGNGSTLTFSASVTATGGPADPFPANNADSESGTVIAEADVAAFVSVEQSTLTPATESTLVIAAVDLGPADAHGVTVTLPLPEGASFVAAGEPCSATGQTVTCSFGDLPVGQGAAAQVRFAIGAAATGQLSFTTTAVSSGTDPVAANNSRTATAQLATVADLTLAKSASVATAAPGEPVTFTLSARNSSSSSAPNVVVTDVVPAGTRVVTANASAGSYDASTGRWTIGTLAAGTAATLRVELVADTATEVRNLADITSGAVDPTPDDNTAVAEVRVLAASLDSAPVELAATGLKPGPFVGVGATMIAVGVLLLAARRHRLGRSVRVTSDP